MHRIGKYFVVGAAVLFAPAMVFAQNRQAPMQLAPYVEPPAQKSCTAASSSVAERAFPCKEGPVKSGSLELPDGSIEVIEYEVMAPGLGVTEGDILLRLDENDEILSPRSSTSGLDTKSAGRSSLSYRWGFAKIPYVNSLTYFRSRVDAAIDHWEQNTKLVFVPRTNESDYVDFVSGTGCSSYAGRQGGRQEITLENNCSTGNTIHEIGHAVGFWHEQNRRDRDNYVNILWQNIKDDKTFNFETYIQRGEDGFDYGSYDFGSIMHYGSYDFSKNGLPTITKKDGSTFSVQRSALSLTDRSSADYMYAPRIAATYWCTEFLRECHFSVTILQGRLPIQSSTWYFDDTPQTVSGLGADHTFSTYGAHEVEVAVYDGVGDLVYGTINLYLDPDSTCLICN